MLGKTRASGGNPKTRRWLYIALGVGIGYVFVFGDYGLYNYFRLIRLRHRIVREIDDLRREREQLTAELERLSSDRAYLEKVAREKYRLGRPNERIYVLRKRND
jgi:cell division protein FtsB